MTDPWLAPIAGVYGTFERLAFVAICPISDIRPHEIDSMTCPCGATTHIGDTEEVFRKPFVIHNRHSDNDRIEHSMKSLGIGQS